MRKLLIILFLIPFALWGQVPGIGRFHSVISDATNPNAWSIDPGHITLDTSYVFTEFSSTNGYHIHWKPDGTKMYLVVNNDYVYQYNLSTPWEIRTISYHGRFYNYPPELGARALAFNPNGLQFFLTGETGDKVYSFSLSTAWDITTASYDNVSISAGDPSPRGIVVNPDGTKLYIVTYGTRDVEQYTLSTPWDLLAASYDASIPVTDFSLGITFSSDGKYIYNQTTKKYELTIPWDVSSTTTSTPLQEFNLFDNLGGGTYWGVTFNDVGTRMFAFDLLQDKIYQFIIQ